MNTQDTVHRKSAAELRIRRVMDALEKNNMQAYYAPTCADAVKIAKELLQPGDVISCGGSVTLDETGVMDLMRCGDYEFLDRTTAKTPEEREKLYREVFSSDVFLTGTNAVTEHGELYNVDGNGNRVAAIAFGPKKAILVVGCNKLVADLHEAETRLETLAAPANTKRLSCATPCRETGVCAHCHSPARVCCTYTVQRFQRQKGRIHVILVAEPLGF